MIFRRPYTLNAFHIVGAFFLTAQCFILSALLFDPTLQPFLLWSCNNFCFFLAFACFRQNMEMLKGISYVSLIAQLLWIFDFNAHLFNFNPLNITDYIFIEGFTYANDVSIALHMIIPVAVLLFSFRARPKLVSLAYAIPYIIVLYGATILLTSNSEDINCVFSGCNINLGFTYNSAFWLFYALITAFLGYCIHYALFCGWKFTTQKLRTSQMRR